jgi:hypothetical protein
MGGFSRGEPPFPVPTVLGKNVNFGARNEQKPHSYDEHQGLQDDE